MSRKYDIAERIANGNQKPTLKFDEKHEFKINNSKNVALMVDALQEKYKDDSIKMIDEIICTTLGKEAFDYIESLELSFSTYKDIVNVIMAAFQDKTLEEIEQEQEEVGKK